MEVRPLTATIGAEVFDVDLASEPSPALADELYQLLLDHLVLFFPGQFLGPDQLRTLVSHYGSTDTNPAAPKVPGYDDAVELVDKVPDIWHFDSPWVKCPSKLSMLSMVRCPPAGGDTQWLNSYAVYEALSEPIRELLDGLTAVHDGTCVGRSDLRYEHPAVRVHPDTGRKHIFVAEFYTVRFVELSKTESDMLLRYLYRMVDDPRFACRYRWTEGVAALWDNRSTLHRVVSDRPFEGGSRVIQRVTVSGDEPAGPGARWPRYEARATAAGRAQAIDNPATLAATVAG